MATSDTLLISSEGVMPNANRRDAWNQISLALWLSGAAAFIVAFLGVVAVCWWIVRDGRREAALDPGVASAQASIAPRAPVAPTAPPIEMLPIDPGVWEKVKGIAGDPLSLGQPLEAGPFVAICTGWRETPDSGPNNQYSERIGSYTPPPPPGIEKGTPIKRLVADVILVNRSEVPLRYSTRQFSLIDGAGRVAFGEYDSIYRSESFLGSGERVRIEVGFRLPQNAGQLWMLFGNVAMYPPGENEFAPLVPLFDLKGSNDAVVTGEVMANLGVLAMNSAIVVGNVGRFLEGQAEHERTPVLTTCDLGTQASEGMSNPELIEGERPIDAVPAAQGLNIGGHNPERRGNESVSPIGKPGGLVLRPTSLRQVVTSPDQQPHAGHEYWQLELELENPGTQPYVMLTFNTCLTTVDGRRFGQSDRANYAIKNVTTVAPEKPEPIPPGETSKTYLEFELPQGVQVSHLRLGLTDSMSPMYIALP